VRSEVPSISGWYAVVVRPFASTIHSTVWPGSTQTPMGSNQTSETSTSLFMWLPAPRAPRASRATARPASASPPAAKNLRRVSTELLEQRLLVCRDVPENDVIVRLGHARMARVVVHVDVVHPLLGDVEVVELLVSVQFLQRGHVDRAHELALSVVREERTGRKRGRHDVERADAREEIGELHEAGHLLVLTAGRCRRERLRRGLSAADGEQHGKGEERGQEPGKFKVTKDDDQSPPARRDKAGHPEATDQTGAQRHLPGRDPGGQPGRSEAAFGDASSSRARHPQEEGGQATKSADLPLSALRAGRRDPSQAV